MKKTIAIMTLVTIVGLVMASCAKKEEQAAPPTPTKTAVPSTPTKEQAARSAVEQTAQVAQETAVKGAQEANQVQEAAKQVAAEQTVCTVMKGQPIDKSIFVEYQGKKVYFCCESCKAAFEKDPEKYVKDLPQFRQ